MYLISSFSLISLFVPYAYVSIESIDCIFLSSLALNVISANKLCFSRRCGFNINLLYIIINFFMNFLSLSFGLSVTSLLFLGGLFPL